MMRDLENSALNRFVRRLCLVSPKASIAACSFRRLAALNGLRGINAGNNDSTDNSKRSCDR